MPPSSFKAGTKPLASKTAWDAIANLEMGLRWRLNICQASLAWITAGMCAADVVLQEDASEELLMLLRLQPEF
jgi:hypothetical protein